MSFDPTFNGLARFIDVADAITYDDIQFYDNLTAINNITDKNLQTRYVDSSNGNEYRYNGTSLILMNSGTGSLSLSAGNQITITGTLPNQTINFNTNDNTAVLNGQLLIGNTLTGQFAKSTLSGEANYINIVNGAGTSQITLNTDFLRRVGAYRPFDYFFQSPATTAGQISANSGNSTVITSMSIGFLPVNRGLNEIDYVRDLMDKLRTRLPFKIRILNTVSNTYASYNATAYNGAGALNYSFTVSYLASESNMVGGASNFVNGNRLFVYLEEFIPRTANDITATAQSILTTTNLQTQLTTTNTILGLVNKATLPDSNIQMLLLGAPLSGQSDVWSFQSNGEFSYYIPLGGAIDWNRSPFITPNISIKAIRNNQNAFPQSRFLAVRLTGSSWARTNGLRDVAIGFATKKTMQTVQNWATTNLILNYTGVWNANEKVIRARFLGAGVEFNYGSSNAGTISGASPDDNSLVNDVLIFQLLPTGVFYLEHRRASNYAVVVKSGTINHPDGVNYVNNFNCDDIVPVVSCNLNNTTSTLQILSKRATDSLGITLTNSENIFW